MAIQDEGVEPKGFAPIGIVECWNNGIHIYFATSPLSIAKAVNAEAV